MSKIDANINLANVWTTRTILYISVASQPKNWVGDLGIKRASVAVVKNVYDTCVKIRLRYKKVWGWVGVYIIHIPRGCEATHGYIAIEY